MIYSLVILSPETLAGYLVTGFFTVINLLVTYFIIKRFLFKPAIKFMKKRSDIVTDQLANAKLKQDSAEALLVDARRNLEKANRDASNIIEDAKTHADMQSSSIVEAARREAILIVGRGHDDVQRMKKAAVEEMKDDVADLSIAIAYKIVSHSMDEKRQKELVDQFISDEFAGKADSNV